MYGPYPHHGRHYFTWLLRGPQLRTTLSRCRGDLPESRKREQFDRWLEQRQRFFFGDQFHDSPMTTADTDR